MIQRDRLTWLIYLQVSIYAFFLYGFNVAIPLLGHDLHVSRAVAGLHSTLYAVGVLVASLASPLVAAGRGRGAALWGGLGGMCVALLLFAGPPVLPFTLIGAFAGGLSAAMVANTIAPALSDAHSSDSAAVITEANSLAAMTGAVSPFLIGIAVSVGLGWRPALFVTVALVAGTWAAFHRDPIPNRTVGAADVAPASGLRGARALPARYWWAWGVLVCCIAIEFSMTTWASQLLSTRTGVSAGVAALATTAIVAGMALGRLFGSRLTLRFHIDPLLAAALLVCVLGFVIAWTTRIVVIGFVGLVLSGVGIGLHFPLGITRAIHASGGQPDLANGLVGVGAAIAIGIGPFALAALADHMGPGSAFLIVPVLVAGALACLLIPRADIARSRA